MKRKKKHEWTRTDGLLTLSAGIGGVIIGFFLSKPTSLEGNFTHWDVYDLIQDPHNFVFLGNNSINVALNAQKTKLVLNIHGSRAQSIYDIASKTIIAGVVNASDSGLAVTYYRHSSIQGTYVADVPRFTDNIVITKNGVVIQTIDVTTLGLQAGDIQLNGALITWDGQYIICVGRDAVTGFQNWLILKGS